MKALEGVKILDMTHVQSGPTCTQLLAWFGADVIKVERPGVGDATRKQLVDVPGADSLYFTMLNHNKRSVTLNTKSDEGKAIFTKLIQHCDVMVENFAPGALDRMGFSWEKIQEINPRMIYASVKGFGPGPYAECKVYENVAQCAGGSASTTGMLGDIPMVTGAQIGDSGTGLHLALGIVTALYQRTHSGKGQRVECAMQDSVLNLCRVKLRDQQRLKAGPLTEYSQFGEGIPFGDATPRAGNDSGGGQPGRILKCKGWETDPNAYTYFITQAAVWEKICDVIGKPEWKTEEDFATPKARLPHLNQIFEAIEAWTMTKTKFEVMEICNPLDIPVGPILSMKEIAEEQSLRDTGTVVEVDHPERGAYLTVGNPIKLSDCPADVKRSPLLGEHTDEILAEIGLNPDEIEAAKSGGAV
ncbi:formyl-CoA transferase [Thalassospiraceae bacterium LMO-SO8]|nr:formyl-CoA transferase [Alphaproteobacteria bacterium LMO-S08]WND74756.1 formyl-CoA transferase [Thalassospiraceae bacterium LMO-SO8]